MEPIGERVVEVRVREVAQLFNSLDPAPFHDRDLDPDAEEFIVDYAREIGTGRPYRIVVHLPPAEVKVAESRHLDTALANFFAYRARQAEHKLRDLFRNGRRHLAVGVVILVICLVASQYVGRILDIRPWGKVVEESLIILGWVANWRPIEIFLYDWWPLWRDVTLFRSLAGARVEIRPADG